MRLVLLVAGLLAVTGSVPVHLQTLDDALKIKNVAERNSVLEQTILNLLEDFRATMLTGTDDIPVLDPLAIDQIDLNGEDFGISGVTFAASDVSVNNLSTFVVDSLDVSALLLINTVTFNATIPSLEIYAGSYSFLAEVLGFNVFGDGSATLKFLNPRLHGSIVVRISIPLFGGQTVTVTDADLNVELAGFEPEVTGLFGDEYASQFANDFLKYFVPEVVFLYQNEISDFLNTNVPDILNEILADIL